jgi:hypothetical protein
MWKRVAIGTGIVVAALGAAVLVAWWSGAGDGDGSVSVEAAMTSAAGEATSEPAPVAVSDEALEEGGASGGDAGVLALEPFGPQVIQTASLSITVGRGEFEDAVAQARTIATGLGGFVTSSSASQGDGSRLVRGAIVLRVPSEAYGRAMSALTELGRVEGRQEAGEDVTAQFVDLRARVRHLEAVETQLLRFLDRTKTVGEALAVQQRLNDVQLQLEEARGRLRYLSDQTAFATITLDVAERGVPVGPPGDGGFGLGDAWGSAVNGLEAIAAGLFVALVTAGPVLVLLGAAFAGVRFLWRRRVSAGGGSAPTPTPPA